MAPRTPDPLEGFTRAIRGMLRYKNIASIELVSTLVHVMRDAAALAEADLSTLGAMVIVDPDLESAYQSRTMIRRKVLAELRQQIHLVELATEQAKKELESEGGRP